MTRSALYLYCVMRAADAMPHVAAPALDGGTVQVITHRDLAVLAHACRPEPYQGGEEQVRRWIGAHNAVVEEAWAAAGSVLPMSFDVIVCASASGTAESNVTGWMAEHHAALRSRLDDLTGRAELGVQVFRDAATTAPAGIQQAGEGAPVPRGRAFFTRQQEERQNRQKLAYEAELEESRYIEALTVLADEVQVGKSRPVPGKRMILNMSLLVPRGGISRIGEYLESANRTPGTEIRFTGPWPPYSFAGSFGKMGRKNEDTDTDSGRL